ncbi:MAG TPA: hypothetical protein DCR48_07470 [Flavobacteriales bacterium]|nr:hypothetical protein [Flavobacteriales bacterium]
MPRILLLFFFFLQLGLSAQDLTKVRFYIKGSTDIFIKLDGELLPMSNIQRIAPGEHKIEVWSPTYNLHKSSINIPNKDSVGHFIELKQDRAYIDYMFAKDEFNQKIFVRRTAPLLLAGAGAILIPFAYVMRKNLHEELILEDFKVEYFNASRGSGQSRYNTVNALFFVGIGATIVGTSVFLALRENVKHLAKPVYIQQNPFTLDDFKLSYNSINRSPEIGVKLSF